MPNRPPLARIVPTRSRVGFGPRLSSSRSRASGSSAKPRGTITQKTHCQERFSVNAPLGLALIPLALLRLDESRGPNPTLDLVGTILASGGLFGIVYALVRGNADGWTSTPVLGGFFAGTALLVG